MDPGSEPSRPGAACVDHNFPLWLPAGEVRTCWLTLRNDGRKVWHADAVRVSIDLDGAPLFQLDLPHPVDPGGRVSLHWVFRTPKEAGRHEFKLALGGALPLHVPFDIVAQPATKTSRLRDQVYESHARCWLACDGMTWSSTGAGFPQFAREARGCWITDVEGHRYVDYLMGWGTALLGYAHERVQAAVAGALASGATLTLTHHLMPEVAEMLCDLFPGAEAATFGKNGSDVCTAAVRMARVHTGRPVVLHCGYHGWQDWYAERYGFAATGIPTREEPLLVPFEPNNLEQVARLLDMHRGKVAAVMLEPAGAIEGSSGPVRDADPVFLKEMVALVRREGALVIFDEILTGFRHSGGSVQHATGVVPDLTCLGKALSNGMPLSALIGRREIFDGAIGRIFFEPTFKGEAYSFAAAREALSLYREQDIPARISAFGNRLRAMIDRMCKDFRVPASVIGPPFRMLVAFSEADARRRTLMRTLLQQELLKQGVLTTQNLFLPSAAHDDEALEHTRGAFEHALGIVAEAMKSDRFAAFLEIPPLPG